MAGQAGLSGLPGEMGPHGPDGGKGELGSMGQRVGVYANKKLSLSVLDCNSLIGQRGIASPEKILASVLNRNNGHVRSILTEV